MSVIYTTDVTEDKFVEWDYKCAYCGNYERPYDCPSCGGSTDAWEYFKSLLKPKRKKKDKNE